jgi:hypothetical protein
MSEWDALLRPQKAPPEPRWPQPFRGIHLIDDG